MKRLSFVMQLHAGKEEEYERRHTPIWSELEETLFKHGVKSYSIFLHPETKQLFGYVECESEERLALVAKTEICQKWWKSMAPFYQVNPDSSPVQIPLKEVFHIEAF